MNLIFVDNQNCEWKVGKSPVPKAPEIFPLKTFILPFCVDAMYPEDYSEFIYSHCCKCGESLERGLIAIVFKQDESEFGVRIVCEEHWGEGAEGPLPKEKSFGENPGPKAPGFPITSVFDILKPIIDKGCSTINDKCPVCEGPSKCAHPTCIYLKDKLEKDTLFDHFYNIKLNVISPFVEPICHYCKRLNAKKSCKSCKLYMFCSSKCREKSDHKCQNEFYDIWRS